MIESYNELPVMYKATLVGTELVIEPITPHVYRRIGTAGLGHTKVEAVELLKLRIMKRFEQDLSAVNWQARQLVPGLS